MNFNARLFPVMMRASRVLVNQISILSSVIWHSARREVHSHSRFLVKSSRTEV
jgi:hypothetical protein